MVEVSTSILTVKKGEEAETFFALEKAKTDYFHIDVMDGKFVEKDTYKKMMEYASYTSNDRKCAKKYRRFFSSRTQYNNFSFRSM